MQDNKNIQCSCPNTECPRHGNCEDCTEHHLIHEKEPHCQREEIDSN